jgi:hypothetical protein
MGSSTTGLTARGVRVLLVGTALGILAASAAHPAPEMSKPLPPRWISEARPGMPVILTLRDGRRVDGSWLDGGRATEEDYRARLAAWRGSVRGDPGLPGLDDPVIITYPDSARVSGTFHGFNFRGIEVLAAGDSTARLVPYPSFTRLEAPGGHAVAADSLDAMDARGDLPSLALVRLESRRAVVTVPLERVRSVQLPVQSLREKLAGVQFVAGVGLSVGAIVLLAAGLAAGITAMAALLGGLAGLH